MGEKVIVFFARAMESLSYSQKLLLPPAVRDFCHHVAVELDTHYDELRRMDAKLIKMEARLREMEKRG